MAKALFGKRVSSLLEQAGAKALPRRCERRGNFTALSAGVSYGGGHSVGRYPSFSHVQLIHRYRSLEI